mmetsp:Transcript_32075/g.57555  ORF Transcript_32075/g.57555 Transcript_32075/m.57555 type:complete len:249 (-) Transcript_32075:671-1417(-)
MQELGGPGTLLLVALQAAGDELAAGVRQRFWNGRCSITEPDDSHGMHNVVKSGLPPRIFSCSHLQHNAAEAPNVCLAAVSAGVLEHFWRHPVRCSQGSQRLGSCGGALGAAKIRQLHAEVEVHKDIGSLQVAVHDRRLVRVQVVQALRYSTSGLLEQLSVQGAELIEDVPHRAAWDVLHADLKVALAVHVPKAAHHVAVAQILANPKLFQHLLAVTVVVLPTFYPGDLHGENLATGAVLGHVDVSISP